MQSSRLVNSRLTANVLEGKMQMAKRHYIRTPMFVVLVVITLLFLYKAIVAPPDPGYGRVFNFLIYGLFTLLVWIPYNITCMFLDGNKALGTVAVVIVALTLGFVELGAWVQEFGIQTLALLLCILALMSLWILSAVSFIVKKRSTEPTGSRDGVPAARDP